MSIRHNGAIIAGAGGGAEPDETTIDLNSSQKLEALGTKNKNTSSSIGQVFNWVGTLQEHTTQQIATLHPEWICYITDDTSAGRAPFFLFQFQYTDYVLNEPGWVNADAFNWCSGATYLNAYTHLVNDISGITAETETIGSYTVTFYRATDGHKICLADQETTVSNIFSETGVAWYYILDTQNSRFKLPRKTTRVLTEKYVNGTSLYNLYSDGWCEQSGQVSLAGPVNLLKSYKDTNYIVNTTVLYTGYTNWGVGINKNSNSQININMNTGSNGVIWQTYGYTSLITQNYLEFYLN